MSSPISPSPKPPTAFSENNRTQIVYGKKLDFEFTRVVDNKGTENDIWVQQIEGKTGYFRVTSPSKPYTNTPVKLRDAEKIIDSWKKGFEAQGIKPESQEPKFAKP
ncbi:MAG: hypothetical protein ACK5T0_01675 [Vampirovibrionales bacterium]